MGLIDLMDIGRLDNAICIAYMYHHGFALFDGVLSFAFGALDVGLSVCIMYCVNVHEPLPLQSLHCIVDCLCLILSN